MKKNIVTANIKAKAEATTISHCHLPLERSNIKAAAWIPTMFPKLLHVAQSPTMNPRVFLGNQFPLIDMKHGRRKALNMPMKLRIT
jgi:hypothetical protein